MRKLISIWKEALLGLQQYRNLFLPETDSATVNEKWPKSSAIWEVVCSRMVRFFQEKWTQREVTFFKVVSILALQQNCICRLHSEEAKATQAFEEKIRPCCYSFRNQCHPIQKPKGRSLVLMLSCKEPTSTSFLISQRQAIKKLSVNRWSCKKNMQGKILSTCQHSKSRRFELQLHHL